MEIITVFASLVAGVRTLTITKNFIVVMYT